MYLTLIGERSLGPIMTSTIVNLGDLAACSSARCSCAAVSTRKPRPPHGRAARHSAKKEARNDPMRVRREEVVSNSTNLSQSSY